MRDSDWLKLNLRWIFLICVQTQILCNGAYYVCEFVNAYCSDKMNVYLNELLAKCVSDTATVA